MRIKVKLSTQSLMLEDGQGSCVRKYLVSTAKNGPGQKTNSYCTPLGLHIIRAKVGRDLPVDAVLIGRRWQGEIYSHALAEQFPNRDWVLTRILWLSGLEKDHNRGGDCDTMRRFIYIHGTPETEPMGVPASHGCVRMYSADIIDLFDRVPVYTVVSIEL